MERQSRQPSTPEEEVARAWAALRPGSRVRTQEGERVEVRFPGLPNPGPGPDFRRAVLRSERGRLVRGDVEVHQSSAGWDAHGHRDDPRYRNVVLHVVARDDRLAPVARPGGGRAPALVLRSGPPARDVGSSGDACAQHRAGAGAPQPGALALLQQLGEQRFRAKTRWWRARISAMGADEALFAGLVAGMGHGEDRAPFRRLAVALPWPTLCAVIAAVAPDERVSAAQACLLGTAGLLDLGAPPPLLASWRAQWQQSDGNAILGAGEWPRGGRRPNAAPWRRLAGLGVLAARWGAGPGPVAALQAGVAGAEPRQWPQQVRRLLSVEAGPAGLDGPAPIGRGRADGLGVNVALPLLGALAVASGDREAERRVESAYAGYPGLEADTVVRRLVTALELSPPRLSACVQQGLHQLHRGYCLRGRQQLCPCCRPG